MLRRWRRRARRKQRAKKKMPQAVTKTTGHTKGKAAQSTHSSFRSGTPHHFHSTTLSTSFSRLSLPMLLTRTKRFDGEGRPCVWTLCLHTLRTSLEQSHSSLSNLFLYTNCAGPRRGGHFGKMQGVVSLSLVASPPLTTSSRHHDTAQATSNSWSSFVPTPNAGQETTPQLSTSLFQFTSTCLCSCLSCLSASPHSASFICFSHENTSLSLLPSHHITTDT